MSVQTREQRFVRAKRLLNKVKHPENPDMLWFYSDENNFDQDQKINRRNDSCLCGDPSDVPHVMVLGVVGNEEHFMPSHFFRQGRKIEYLVRGHTYSNRNLPLHIKA